MRPWSLSLLAAVGLFVPLAPLTAQSGPADLSARQQVNAKQFAEFKVALLRLAQKYQRSDKPEDQDRAKVILAALDLAAKENVEGQFQTLVAEIGRGANSLPGVGRAVGQDQQLTKALQEIFNVLMTDDESARLKAEIMKLEQFLKQAKDIKRAQELLRALNDANRVKADKIAKDQGNLAERTKELSDRMGGPKKDGGAGDKETPKAEGKADAKPGDQAGEKKDDSGESKADAKPDAGGDPKAGEPKSGDPKAGDPKSGDKGPDAPPKAGGEKPEAKAGGDKPGEPKAGEPKADPSAAKPGGSPKGPPPADAAAKPSGDNKSQGAGKGEAKASKGEPGGEGKGQNAPKGGEAQASSGKGAGAKPSAGSPPGGQPPPPQQQAQQTPGRKQLEEAYPHQKGAEDDLNKEKRPQAGKGQDKAIEALARAIQELEKRLRQLREDEALKRLADLEARCTRMLALQREVYGATQGIDAAVRKNNNQKTTADVQKAQQQGDKEGEIVAEADRALKLMEGEGSAVAFALVLEEVRQDMAAVQRRLGAAYVGDDTQAVEQNVIAMLEEMLRALKKAQQDIQQQQQQQQQGGSPPPGGPQKLLTLINELKLIRSLQVQVNGRTKVEGAKEKVEQATDPILQAEIQQLSARQAKLQDMIQKIATGANE